MISIIGAGGMAGAIGRLAAKAGHSVDVASRDSAKASALAQEIGLGAVAAEFGAAPAGDFVVLAVPYGAVLDVVAHYGDALAGKILIDITNPIAPDLSHFLNPEGSSGAKEIAKAAPGDVSIVKAFNTQSSQILTAGSVDGRPLDIFIAGDDAEAKARVSAFIESLGLRSLDAGPLAMAWTLEQACMLWLGVMTHATRHPHFALSLDITGRTHTSSN